jgi:flagellar biosynthesis/type III secretory pathway protein FliH
LKDEEQKQFDAEMKALPKKEREGVMELTTSWKEEGIQIGLQQGLQQGKADLVLTLLRERIGKINKSNEQRISRLSIGQLTELGKALLNFKDKSDLEKWLSKASSKN